MTNLIKGEQGGLCNRTACQQPPALFYNSVMRKYYCHNCAVQIERAARRDGSSFYADLDERYRSTLPK